MFQNERFVEACLTALKDGGDFFTVPRSEWESTEAPEQPFSLDRAVRTFAEANERAKTLLARGS